MFTKSKIKNISAREILNSGATTSLEVTATLNDGSKGVASVPFGSSAGSHEAYVLFDGDERYGGKGMLKAVANVNGEIREALLGADAYNQTEIDQIMIDLDGTPNKKRLGGNAILGVSLAVAKVAASSKGQELYEYINKLAGLDAVWETQDLPGPMIVVIEGGKHAENSTDFQEYLIVTQIRDKSGKLMVNESVRAGAEIYLSLKKVLKKNKYNTNVGNEGAYAPSGIKNNEEPWALISEAISQASYNLGQNVMLAADPACAEMIDEQGNYFLKSENRTLTPEELTDYFIAWTEKYPFISLEDILGEDDWVNWVKAHQKLGDKIKLIGDDLLVTNPDRLDRAIKEKACNSILIKLNQIGSLTETITTINKAHEAGFWTVVSHRGGGETIDTAMIDLAVGCGSKFVKVGIARGERSAKYNRLMEIELNLNKA